MVLSIVIIFFQRRDPRTVWTWLLVLYFLPVVGFFLYLIIGVDMHKRKIFKTKAIEDQILKTIRHQERMISQENVEKTVPQLLGYSDLVMFNLESCSSILTDDNEITIYADGGEKFKALLEDIRNAKEFIHIQYYIIKRDALFLTLLEELKKKAAEGVEVRIIFDAMGCRSVRHEFWKEINRYGIETAEFFPAFMRRLHLRVNYRNHRKIVVIDNKIGYVGGYNIGKEYVGLDKKFGYWRDTHLRIVGGAILSLQMRFLLDWNHAAHQNLFENPKYMDAESVSSGETNPCEVQIVTSGPDSLSQNVKNNYVRLINKAKKSIYMQTPYFIPDEAVFTALYIAVKSGIEVNIMIPCKPDHPFVYWATRSYIGELVEAGANCYTYNNGFLHAKTLVIDENAFSCGTANMDIRSFSLNFEVNAIVYDERKAKEMVGIFREDLELCTKITKEMQANRPLIIRAKEQVSRLLSPLL